jgi:hypothetical protein
MPPQVGIGTFWNAFAWRVFRRSSAMKDPGNGPEI